MSPTESRTAHRRTGPGLLAALGLLGVLLVGALAAWRPPFPSVVDASHGDAPQGSGRTAEVVEIGTQHRFADGSVPAGVTVWDDQFAAVANLDPDLLAALRKAASAAADDAIEFHVNSGWRSEAHQARLLQDAIARYGSLEQASRWVATPQTSPHVSGDAVDIGGDGAADWLAAHGAAYDLCRIYANEPWHFELRPGADAAGCPATYADPSRDPRLQP